MAGHRPDRGTRMKRILMTGATGFLGGWLTGHFLQQGHEVHVVRNPGTSIRKDTRSQYDLLNLGSRCTEHRIDLMDQQAVAQTVAGAAPDIIVHMAAIGDVGICARNPTLAFNTSALSTLNLLEALRTSRPDTLFLSHTTDKVYSGNPTPFTEDMHLRPSHIYEAAKIAQENLTTVYAEQYGLKTITIRCGNYFGGYDFNFDRIIPYVIRQILTGQPVELRSNGKFTRDFLYIEDAVLVNDLLIAKHLSGDFTTYGEAFNFSLEVKLSVLELVETLCRLMGHQPDVIINDQAKSEIPDMQLDCSKARRVLGWTPRFTLEEGLKRSISAYTDYFAAAAA